MNPRAVQPSNIGSRLRSRGADLPEVVHHPDRVEPCLVGGADHPGQGGSDRLGAAGPCERVDLEPKPHRTTLMLNIGFLVAPQIRAHNGMYISVPQAVVMSPRSTTSDQPND